MEIHHYFIKITSFESSIFEIFYNTLEDSIDSITLKFIHECLEESQLLNSKKHLEILRFLLCQHYKLRYEQNRNSNKQLHMKFCNFIELCINNQLHIEKKTESILNDVIVLQLVLLEKTSDFIQLFKNFQTSNSTQVHTNNFLTDVYLKILICFLKAWELINFLSTQKESGNINKIHLESSKTLLLSSVINHLQIWIQYIKHNEWYILYSVLSKVVSIAKNTRILTPCIYDILDKKDTLTPMCVLCDFIFPMDNVKIDVDFSLIYHKNLWFMIQNYLVSSCAQERKEALYLFKRINDFIDKNEKSIKEEMSSNLIENKINPFICNQPNLDKLEIKTIRTNFILIMEALEEKQKHLIIPCLSLIDSLIEGCLVHRFCGNCFDFKWIYCVFMRVLGHANNGIVKWGLLRSLKLTAEAYNNNSFFVLIIKSLNNTFLFEKLNNETIPEVVNSLSFWFSNFQNENLNLIEKFVYYACEISWGPVPMFYVLQSLLSVSDKLANIVNLQQLQLDQIRSIVETNIKLHPPLLRTVSQVMIIKILSRLSKVDNLMILSNLLSVFSIQDIEEGCCWSDLSSWFANIHYDSAVSYISQICQNLIVDDSTVLISMSTFSFVIQLLYEGGVICQTEQCTAMQELATLLLCLDKIDIRPYVKVSLIAKIIDFIYSFIDLQRQFPAFIYNLFINYRQTIFQYILKLFSNENMSYEDITIYSKALKVSKCYIESRVIYISIIDSTNRKDLEDKCLTVLLDPNKYKSMQVFFAVKLFSEIETSYGCNDTPFSEIICNLLHKCSHDKHSNDITGVIASDYYSALSKLIRNHVMALKRNKLYISDTWIQILSNILDVAGNKVLIYFGDIIRLYSMNKINTNEKFENLCSLIKICWNCNFSSKRDRVFWLVAQKLTECINCEELLNFEVFQEIIQEFNSKMLTEGISLPGLKYILLTYSEICHHFKYFMEIMLNALLHGQVMRRDQRINMQSYIQAKQSKIPHKLKDENFENFEVYDFINRKSNIDATVRTAAILQLSQSIHIDRNNASLFLHLVLEKLSSIEYKRYFADSQIHRCKYRIMQILLTLQPFLNKESTRILYHRLCDSILHDTDQHSVQIMKQWLLIKIYLSNKDLLDDLWLFFEKIYDQRPNNISLVIGIVWHIVQQSEEDIEFIKSALKKLAICCMGQQFGMRLFGQIFFIKLYNLLHECSDVKIKYTSFYEATLLSSQCGTFKKNSNKINEDFFYTIFNPVQHYTLETIYHHLPRLTNVSPEEWITVQDFEEQILFKNVIINLKVKNIDNLLNEKAIPYSIFKVSENFKFEEIESDQIMTDLQKKITPWKSMLPNENELTEIVQLVDKQKNQDIILVASLVDKSQNLGGIARTCEIFKVKELVINNLKQIEEKDFQVLSVSADKWIQITEVKKCSLAKYLLELKDCGWTLIGAEQTANSINLSKLNFPKQTVLILGNEKVGIPANILPLLDLCVEIPQFGIIRSLNVHVTSAICIWEYIKQHTHI